MYIVRQIALSLLAFTMYCTISGEVPQEPIVSRISGHVFERRLIEKSLEASNGVCPATGAELKASDLIAVCPRRLDLWSLPSERIS